MDSEPDGARLADPIRLLVDDYLETEREKLDSAHELEWKRRIGFAVLLSTVLFGGSFAGVFFYTGKAIDAELMATVAEQVSKQTTAIVEIVTTRAKTSSEVIDKIIKQSGIIEAQLTEASNVAQEAAANANAAEDASVAALESATKATNAAEEASRVANNASQTVTDAQRIATSARKSSEQASQEATKALEEALAAGAQARGASGELDEFRVLLDELRMTLESGTDVETTVRALLEGSLRDTFVSAVQKELAAGAAPVGAVIAWPDDVIPPNWHICNGKEVPFNEELWEILGNSYGNPEAERVPFIKLPDYRGYFLRAVDGGRGRDSDTDRGVGSTQGFATALPTRSFGTGYASTDHTHAASTTASRQGGPNTFDSGGARGMGPTGRINVKPAGRDHTHVIEAGGDDETRPLNIAVLWIMRIR